MFKFIKMPIVLWLNPLFVRKKTWLRILPKDAEAIVKHRDTEVSVMCIGGFTLKPFFFRIEMMFFSYTSCATFSLINMLGFQFNERINMRLMILTRYLWFICPIQVLDLTNCEGHEAFETTVQFRVSCQFIGDDSAWKQSATDHTIPNSIHRHKSISRIGNGRFQWLGSTNWTAQTMWNYSGKWSKSIMRQSPRNSRWRRQCSTCRFTSYGMIYTFI